MDETVNFIIVAIVGVLLVISLRALWKVVQERKEGFVSRDERTMACEGRAASISVRVGTYFMLALLLYFLLAESFVEELPDLGTGWALIASVLFLTLLNAGLRIVLGRKEGA
jgi:hypothetical protein